jgi:O-antigen/teichoic acid export membrane protein
VPGLWALCIAGPLILIRNGIRRLAFARLHVWTAIALDAIVAVAQLGALLTLGYLGRLTVANIFIVMGGACAVASICTSLLDPQRMRFNPGRMLPDWSQNWSFAKWALRSYLLGFTAPYVLLWIIGLTAGPAAAGLLGMCSTLIGMTNVPVMGLDNVLTPQATHAFTTLGSRGLWPILLRTGAILTAFLGGLALFVFLTGDWLAVFFFGAAGEGTEWILATLAVSATMNGISTVAGNGLWAIDRPRAGFIADLSSMTTTLLAALVFVPPFGALGAAMATLAGMLVAASVRVLMLIRCLRNAESAHATQQDSELVGDQDARLVMETAEAAI